MIMANGDTELKHLLTATLRLLPEHCECLFVCLCYMRQYVYCDSCVVVHTPALMCCLRL